jgi:hypothetical protein
LFLYFLTPFGRISFAKIIVFLAEIIIASLPFVVVFLVMLLRAKLEA